MDYFQNVPSHQTTTVAGLAAGTTTTLTWANDVLYSIKGKAYKKAAGSNQATPTTDAVTGAAFVAVGAGYGSIFVVGFDSGGNLKVAQGSVEQFSAGGQSATAGSSCYFGNAPRFPSLPDTMTPCGYIVVKVGSSGSAWTFGSSNLAGPPSNVAIAYVDCFSIPDRPQVA